MPGVSSGSCWKAEHFLSRGHTFCCRDEMSLVHSTPVKQDLGAHPVPLWLLKTSGCDMEVSHLSSWEGIAGIQSSLNTW